MLSCFLVKSPISVGFEVDLLGRFSLDGLQTDGRLVRNFQLHSNQFEVDFWSTRLTFGWLFMIPTYHQLASSRFTVGCLKSDCKLTLSAATRVESRLEIKNLTEIQPIISYKSEGRIVGRFLKSDCKPVFSAAVKCRIAVGNVKFNRNPDKMRWCENANNGWKLCSNRPSVYSLSRSSPQRWIAPNMT